VVRFRARTVWLFGSLAWGEPDHASDIDIAVAGIDASAYFGALGELPAAAPCGVDLVRIEDAPFSLRTRILEAGEVIGEQDTAGSPPR
jgi:predicted nucleotidyltransferase